MPLTLWPLAKVIHTLSEDTFLFASSQKITWIFSILFAEELDL